MRGALRWVLWLIVATACRGSDVWPGRAAVDPGAEGAEVETADSAAGAGAAGAPVGEGGRLSHATPNSQPSGAPGESDDCYAETVSLEQLHAGRVHGDAPVSVGELTATSQKFLLSEAKSGSCLWGAFVADPQRSGAGSGLLLVSFGAPHAEGEACQSGSDGLPDDLAAGDRLDVQGFVEEYVPAACPEVAPALELRVDAACPVKRIGRGEPPTPLVVDLALADRWAEAREGPLLLAWGGALVQLPAVSARKDPEDLDAVFPFGVIELEQTALTVRSRVHYFDLSQGGPRDPGKAPALAYPARFESVTGVVFLDYCSWGLALRDPCEDLSPAGEACTSRAR